MWVLKASMSTEKTTVGRLAKKHGVVVHLYPLLSNRANEMRHITFTGIITGEEPKRAAFLRDLVALPQVVQFKLYQDHFLCQYQEKPGYDSFYNPEVFYLEPWIIDGVTGRHQLHLGSWERKHLGALYTTLRSEHEGAILKVVKTGPPSLFLFSLFPKLTPKQREAVELAIQHGYYDYPRKIDVQELAKISKLAFSTYQAHLRKAERKLIPASLKASPADTYR